MEWTWNNFCSFRFQISNDEEYFLELINKIVSVGMVDGLFTHNEQKDIIEACRDKVIDDGQASTK